MMISLAVVGSLALTAHPAAAQSAQTSRVSVSTRGSQANGRSLDDTISGDGRYVVFGSEATNLAPGDTNGVIDMFLRDRWAGTTRRITVSASGQQADQPSYLPTISADGRYVAFASAATTLAPGESDEYSNVFVADVHTGTIRRIRVAAPGVPGVPELGDPAISADGRSVMFTSTDQLAPADTNVHTDVYVQDLATGRTSLISVSAAGGAADETSYWGSISATGRYVAFSSEASNLVPGDTNRMRDVFLRDRAVGTTVRVSLTDDERQSTGYSYDPSVSADGRYVVFTSDDPTLAPGDTNQAMDVFLRDIRLGTTTAISVTPGGVPGDGYAGEPEISQDGRRVAFHAMADDLVAADTNGCRDVFVRDLRAGRTDLASVSGTGAQGNQDSDSPHLSTNGRHLVFSSSADNLTPGDTNNVLDVLVRD